MSKCIDAEGLLMLAETNADDALIMQHALRDAGFQNPVVLMQDGESLTAYLTGEGQYSDREAFPLPSLLFLNLRLCLKNGLHVLDWFSGDAKIRQALTIIAISSTSDPAEMDRALKLGAQYCFARPFFYPDLVAKLTQLKMG